MDDTICYQLASARHAELLAAAGHRRLVGQARQARRHARRGRRPSRVG